MSEDCFCRCVQWLMLLTNEANLKALVYLALQYLLTRSVFQELLIKFHFYAWHKCIYEMEVIMVSLHARLNLLMEYYIRIYLNDNV